MIGYSLYFLLAVSLTMLLTVAFRRLRREHPIAPPEEDAAFDRRMAKIEAQFGRRKSGQGRGEGPE